MTFAGWTRMIFSSCDALLYCPQVFAVLKCDKILLYVC